MHLKAEDAASGAVNWHVVDARQSIEEVHSQIVRIVDQTMAAVGDKAVSKLWVK